MSKQIKLNLGSRPTKEEDRLIRALVREAGENCNLDVTFRDKPSAEKPPSEQCRLDEQLAQRVGEAAAKALEEKNDAIKAAGEPSATPVEFAKQLTTARKGWRQTVNDIGWKIVVEAVLKTAWEERIVIWNAVKDRIGMP